jgi:acyl-CoA thioesterase FadM
MNDIDLPLRVAGRAREVGETSGAAYERFVEITRPKDGEVLTKVRSVWVLLDMKTLRPKRIGTELRDRFEAGSDVLSDSKCE